MIGRQLDGGLAREVSLSFELMIRRRRRKLSFGLLPFEMRFFDPLVTLGPVWNKRNFSGNSPQRKLPSHGIQLAVNLGACDEVSKVQLN